jgi:hypothetical protein
VNKLQALTTYLLERQLVLPEQFDSWTEQVDLQQVWGETEQGLHMGNMRYRAVISMERFNDHPGRLMALVGSWLERNDPDRDRHDLPAPTFSIEPIDLANGLFDVDLVMELVDPLYLSEDPAGEYEAFGKTWSFAPFDLWIAESGEVVSHGR